jgi:hypothetical protein
LTAGNTAYIYRVLSPRNWIHNYASVIALTPTNLGGGYG